MNSCPMSYISSERIYLPNTDTDEQSVGGASFASIETFATLDSSIDRDSTFCDLFEEAGDDFVEKVRPNAAAQVMRSDLKLNSK